MIIRQLKSLLFPGGVLLLSLFGQIALGSLAVEAEFSGPAALITAASSVAPARFVPANSSHFEGNKTLSDPSGWPQYLLHVPPDGPLLVTGYIYLPAVVRSPELDFAGRVVERTNTYRAEYGCLPLKLNQQLARAALRHSTDMALHDFVSHMGSDGSSFVSRSEDAGYWNWFLMAENIGAGYTTPEQVVDAWMASGGGHRDNIINCEFKDIGVGYYYLENDEGATNYHTYWTQVFGATW